MRCVSEIFVHWNEVSVTGYSVYILNVDAYYV